MLKKMYDLQKKKGKKGFSMIELIIVIAIMAILMALIGTQLIPYLEKSRARKDQNTLDACLTNFEAAIAEAEYNGGAQKWSGIAGLPGDNTGDPDVKGEYKIFAGAAYDDDTELTAALKSKEAKGATTVIFGINAEGVCYVEAVGSSPEHEGLIVSSKFSGYIEDAPTGLRVN